MKISSKNYIIAGVICVLMLFVGSCSDNQDKKDNESTSAPKQNKIAEVKIQKLTEKQIKGIDLILKNEIKQYKKKNSVDTKNTIDKLNKYLDLQVSSEIRVKEVCTLFEPDVITVNRVVGFVNEMDEICVKAEIVYEYGKVNMGESTQKELSEIITNKWNKYFYSSDEINRRIKFELNNLQKQLVLNRTNTIKTVKQNLTTQHYPHQNIELINDIMQEHLEKFGDGLGNFSSNTIHSKKSLNTEEFLINEATNYIINTIAEYTLGIVLRFFGMDPTTIFLTKYKTMDTVEEGQKSEMVNAITTNLKEMRHELLFNKERGLKNHLQKAINSGSTKSKKKIMSEIQGRMG